ncbi:MAG: chemotaxis response regulator protein-glutamate methylesterase [Planctomycetota bacterium]
MLRILITDDSVFMRSAIGRALAEQPDLEIVGKARDGKEAVRLAKELRPDVVTMDIEMPEMDGLTALRRIMREAPTKVLMCSTLTTEGSMQSLQALRLGAADVIPKDTSTDPAAKQRFLDDLVRRVRGLAQSSRQRNETSTTPKPTAEPPRYAAADFDLVCIASSTGGPPVLETLLAALPADLPMPVVVGQHMPRVFTESMARRLDELCALPVVHGEHGQRVQAGQVVIAPGGTHTHLTRAGRADVRLRMSDEPRDALYMPSADVLFRTAAACHGKRVLGVILTGIGDDGLAGARDLHAAGAPVLAQDRDSCVVYGMPRAVTEAGLAAASLAPPQIAGVLQRLTRKAAA